jgi:NNP family nitrate/nitrite transporter-like MFS transporter
MRNHKLTQTNNSQKYIALALATFALSLNFWAWSLLSPLGTQYASELALNPMRLSFLLAVPVIIGALGRIAFGVITDKIGGRAAFITVCLVTAVPVFGLALVDTYQQLLMVAIALGTGGASFVIGIPYISAWFPPERRGYVLGLYSMGNAGTALSGFATPRLADTFGRDQTFIFVGALLVVMAVLFVLLGKNAPSWKRPKGSSLMRLIKASRFRVTRDLSAVYVITFGAFVAFGVYLPVILAAAYDLSLTDAATRAAGFVLLATIARPVGGWLSDKVGGKKVIKVALFAVAVLACFVAFQPLLEVHTTVAYLSLAFMLGCSNGAVFALAGKLTGSEIMGSVTGIIGAAGGLGGFVPPLILGLTYQQAHSYAPALVMLSVCSIIALIYINVQFKDKALYHRI